jgi:hypothetical protein
MNLEARRLANLASQALSDPIDDRDWTKKSNGIKRKCLVVCLDR